MKSVLKDWVLELTLQLQGTLLGAVRGPDGVNKRGAAKPVVRAYRAALMHNALPLGPQNTYAGGECATDEEVERCIASFEEYPLHWVIHFLWGAAIIGYWHPDPATSAHWLGFYTKGCAELHLNPQTKEQMREWLKGDGI